MVHRTRRMLPSIAYTGIREAEFQERPRKFRWRRKSDCGCRLRSNNARVSAALVLHPRMRLPTRYAWILPSADISAAHSSRLSASTSAGSETVRRISSRTIAVFRFLSRWINVSTLLYQPRTSCTSKWLQFVPLGGWHIVPSRVMLAPNVNGLNADDNAVQLANHAQNRRQIRYGPLHKV